MESRIERALRMGDFDLLIAWDRISPQAQLAEEAIWSTPTLRFRFKLLDVRIYPVGESGWPWIVVPRLIESVEPVERLVVRIEQLERTKVVVEPIRAAPEKTPGPPAFISAEDFLRSPDLKTGFAELYRDFERDWMKAGGEARHSPRLLRWVYNDSTGETRWPLIASTETVEIIWPVDSAEMGLSASQYHEYERSLAAVPALKKSLDAAKSRVRNEYLTTSDLQILLEATLRLIAGQTYR